MAQFRKTVPRIIIAVILLAGAFLAIRFFFGGDEDTWICDGERWVKHGNPSAEIPKRPCGNQADQPYTTFSDAEFEVSYPYWPNLPKEQLMAPEMAKAAVGNAGCGFVVSSIPIPPEEDFKAFIERRLEEQQKTMPVRVISKTIGDNVALFEGEIEVNGVTIHTVQKEFLTSKHNLYLAAFMAEKSRFEETCRPHMDKAFGTIKVK